MQGYWKGEKALTMPVAMTKGLEPMKCANMTQDSDHFRGGDSSGREETDLNRTSLSTGELETHDCYPFYRTVLNLTRK